MAAQSITLYHCDPVARTDKQYTVSLQAAEGGSGWLVICWNGRRGGHQTEQRKTKEPVALPAAEKLFAKTLRGKLAEGYQAGEPSAEMAIAPKPVERAASSYRPMLLNPIDAKEAEGLLRDPEWYLQQKVDGVRAIVELFGGTVTTRSRTDKPVALTAAIVKALFAQYHDVSSVVLDCEVCGPLLVLFDVLCYDGVDLRDASLRERLGLLDSLALNNPCSLTLSYLQTARTACEKRDVLQLLHRDGAEGVVFKHSLRGYTAGRPASDGPARKWKFVASATVRVGPQTPAQQAGRRSVTMLLADGTEVGSCTIPPNRDIPEVGQLIEVTYLYALRGGDLTQAVYKGVREDAESADAADALQYKGEAR